MTASDLSSLASDLPTTPADVEAQRRARDASHMGPTDIVSALEQLGTLSPERLRSRPGPRGEPFTLPSE